MKLERKERSERKKTILDFNHIDPSIPPEKLEEIEKLYATYKKLWWCFKQLYQKEKLLELGEKIVSSVLVGGGVVAGGATANPIILGVISGMGLILKTIQEAKNRGKRLKRQGGICGICRMRIFGMHRIVALTAVRATI